MCSFWTFFCYYVRKVVFFLFILFNRGKMIAWGTFYTDVRLDNTNEIFFNLVKLWIERNSWTKKCWDFLWKYEYLNHSLCYKRYTLISRLIDDSGILLYLILNKFKKNYPKVNTYKEQLINSTILTDKCLVHLIKLNRTKALYCENYYSMTIELHKSAIHSWYANRYINVNSNHYTIAPTYQMNECNQFHFIIN